MKHLPPLTPALLALVFLLLGVRAQSTWAPTAGQRICNQTTMLATCGSSGDNCGPFGSFVQGTAGLAPPFSSSFSRQLIALPFRYSGEGNFTVQSVHMHLATPSGTPLSGNFLVSFHKPNVTNAQVPGATLDGTPAGGQSVLFQNVSTYSMGSKISEMVGTLSAPFNVTPGTYFVVVAGYNATIPTASIYWFPGWESSSNQYMAAYSDLNKTGTLQPFVGQVSNASWITFHLQVCLWVDGVAIEPPSNTTGNGTTTGNTTTTTTTTGSSTTGGNSGGDGNPTDFLVRYTLGTDINSWSPANFTAGVATTLHLNESDSVQIFAARRVVVQGSAKRTVAGTGTAVDFYISGPDGAALMVAALSVKQSDLIANGVDIVAAPQQVSANGSPASTLRPAAFHWLFSLLARWL